MRLAHGDGEISCTLCVCVDCAQPRGTALAYTCMRGYAQPGSHVAQLSHTHTTRVHTNTQINEEQTINKILITITIYGLVLLLRARVRVRVRVSYAIYIYVIYIEI